VKPWRLFSHFLLFGSFSISLYFAIQFTQLALRYTALSEKTAARAKEWQIEEESSRFGIWALYEYQIQEKILTARARVAAPLFLNEKAAEAELKALSKVPLTAYYNPTIPTQSALDRAFPTGYAIRFILSFLVSIYFFVFKKKLKSQFN